MADRQRPSMGILQKDIQMIEEYLGISPDALLSYNELRTFIKKHYEEALKAKYNLKEFIDED